MIDNENKICPLNTNYLIYQDGRVYSLISNKFLKPRKTYSHNKQKIYYSVMFGDKKTYLITRLVMFVFGDHNYKNIKDMPKIVQLDKNVLNCHISNLKFATCSEINLFHGLKPSDKCYDTAHKNNIKIPETEIEIVKFLRSKNKTLSAIGKMYNVSEMSVHRFIKRHNII